MTKPAPRPTNAGGFLIAVGVLAGTVIGIATRQPSIGFLAGLATGAALALLLWWRGRG